MTRPTPRCGPVRRRLRGGGTRVRVLCGGGGFCGGRALGRSIERLCDKVRHSVEQVRAHERKILHLCVDKAHMPRAQFIKTFRIAYI